MQYPLTQPNVDLYGGKFTDGNPLGGIPSSRDRAVDMNLLYDEMIAVVVAAGFTPTEGVSTQVRDAILALIKGGDYKDSVRVASTAAINLAAPGANIDGVAMVAGDRFLEKDNATLANRGIYIWNGAAVAATRALDADIGTELNSGAIIPVESGTVNADTNWQLTTDGVVTIGVTGLTFQQIGASQTISSKIQPITASVAASALTTTLNPTALDFRSNALTSGTVNTRIIAAAISLIVPSTATLGTISAQQSRLALLAIDNAGTVELAIINIAGGNNLDETTLISTTAIAAASNAANVIYSTTARAGVPFRVVGYIESTQAVAGTWATPPSTIQGMGGQALAVMSSFGFGQTQQVLTGSRSLGSTYYNPSNKPIFVEVVINIAAGGAITFIKNGVTTQNIGNNTAVTTNYTLVSIVFPGQSYSAVASGTPSYTWTETR